MAYANPAIMASLPPGSQRLSGEHARPSPQQNVESANGSQTGSSPAPESRRTSPRQGHKKLVFSDPVAFRYLEEDPATTVLERRRRLEGYELYIVEQWACSRVHPTFMIATFTGDPTHSILVGVLSIPADETQWSTRMKVYFKAVAQFHAREKETSLGTLMVTNLSGFPSALTVIAVPDGDVKKHREDFTVNENLKRMGCSGRAGMNLQYPQASTIAKFHHLYRTSDSVPLYASVIELVKLCQLALTIYGKLPGAYADGLLCDITEKAVNDWWADIGTYIYNIEPTDGILGPSTVAALLGLLIGAHNRLKAAGVAVGKDIFDIGSTKRAIGAFQKTQRLDGTRRLDRQTLVKLHQTTAKNASGEGWTVPKAVKSTVAEVSGKGGEMVMGILGAREKAGIADIETLDIERLSQLVHGSRLKWLWQGKPLKSGGGELFGAPSDELNGKIFSTDDQGGFMWTGKRDSVYDNRMPSRMDIAYDQASQTGEGRSGFGRLRDAVGLRSHHSKHSKEDSQQDAGDDQEIPGRAESVKQLSTRPDHVLRSPTTESVRDPLQRPDHLLKHMDNPPSTTKPPFDMALAQTVTNASRISLLSTQSDNRKPATNAGPAPVEAAKRPGTPRGHSETPMERIGKEIRAMEFPTEFRYNGPQSTYLRRSQSAIMLLALPDDNPRANRIPRRLSFSAIEDSLLGFEDITATDDDSTTKSARPSAALIQQEAKKAFSYRKARRILFLEQASVPFVESAVNTVENLDQMAQQHVEQLNELYYQRLEEYQSLRATSTEVIGEEKSALAEGLRKVEVLGQKLDYEVNALQSRIQEVEDGLNEFDRNVTDIEARVRELVDEDTGRTSWLYHLLTFFGK
jgi:hypothetical protein